MRIPIRVINLGRHSDRRLYMHDQLNSLGVEYTFVPAIDGKSLTRMQMKEIYCETSAISKMDRPLTLGEIGCAMSHRNIYQEMVQNDLETILILEDDVFLNKKIFVEMLDVRNNFPVDWGIIFLDYQYSENTLFYSIPHKLNLGKYSIKKPIGKRPIYFTSAYLIRKHCAIKLLELTSTLTMPIDAYVGDYKISNIYVITPKIASQDSSWASSLQPERLSVRCEYSHIRTPSPKESYLKKILRKVLKFCKLYKFSRIVKYRMISMLLFSYYYIKYFILHWKGYLVLK